jgi:hypothetical protein
VRWLIVLIVASVGLAACGSSRLKPRPTASASGSSFKPSCTHPSPFDAAPGIGGPEVVGSGTGARLWGLIMAPRVPPVASDAIVKIVWRMTGDGPLVHTGYTFHGKRIPLAWGPDFHGGSNYARPGIEWGVGYHFTTPGCYRLTARRAHGSAVVWLQIKR